MYPARDRYGINTESSIISPLETSRDRANNLIYTTTGYNGEILSELTRTFTMRKFGDEYLINLTEFIG